METEVKNQKEQKWFLVHGQDVKEFILGADFSDEQFRAEFGSEAEYPQVAIGLDHRGSLKETLKYMSDKGMFG